MNITIKIQGTVTDIKKAIAMGWNHRFNEELTYNDIKDVSNKENILAAIPYLDSDRVEILKIE